MQLDPSIQRIYDQAAAKVKEKMAKASTTSEGLQIEQGGQKFTLRLPSSFINSSGRRS